MAKDKKKVNRQEFNPKQALKFFTKSTVALMQEDMKNITVDELIDNLYIPNADKDEQLEYLIREYEKQLLDAKMHPERFESGLHQFYLKMHDYIKKNNIYEKFFELVYLSYVILIRRESTGTILSYYNLLVQQFSYFTGTTKKVPYGIGKHGLLNTDEVGMYLSEINYELHMRIEDYAKDQNLILKLARKYGYNFKSDREFKNLVNYDRLGNNMIFMNCYFISEDNKYLLPYPYRDLGKVINVNPYFMQPTDTRVLKERLQTRQDLLPSKGILIEVRNGADIVEIYMEEVIRKGVIFLLYKIKFIDNTYLTGFYDTVNMLASYSFDSGDNFAIQQYLIEKIVLQNYANLTCELTTEEREEFIDFVEHDDMYRPVMIYAKKEKSEDGKSEHFRIFDRRQYRAELKGVKGYIRKLPIGATASEDAIAKAKKLGIELRADETFVTEFTKKVYKKG